MRVKFPHPSNLNPLGLSWIHPFKTNSQILQGKGREMDKEKERAKKEWLSWYSRDLILPEGGLPDDYMTGVIRVVDGKQYQLDDYENQLEHREFTPLEINIYHAGLVNPNELPAPSDSSTIAGLLDEQSWKP
jgi:hypothetical protein